MCGQLIVSVMLLGGIGSIVLLWRFMKLFKASKRVAVFGASESGKTTLWDGLCGRLSANGRYVSTTQNQEISEFVFKRSNGDKVKVAKGIDIPGKDEIFESACNKILNEDHQIVFFLVAALDLMRGNVFESGARLGKIKLKLRDREGCVIILLITHKRDFIKSYGEDRISEIVGLAHKHYDKYTDKGYDLLELTDAADVDKVKDMIGGFDSAHKLYDVLL